MTLLLALAITAIATAALCVAMRPHQELLFSSRLSGMQKRTLQSAGYGGLALAAFLFARAIGAFVGLTLFAGWFTVCMIGTALTATWLQEHQEGSDGSLNRKPKASGVPQ